MCVNSCVIKYLNYIMIVQSVLHAVPQRTRPSDTIRSHHLGSPQLTKRGAMRCGTPYSEVHPRDMSLPSSHNHTLLTAHIAILTLLRPD